MKDNVRLLEGLVAQAVERLNRLRLEREALRREVGDLRARLEASQEVEREEGQADPDAGWPARRAQALALLREALSELRIG